MPQWPRATSIAWLIRGRRCYVLAFLVVFCVTYQFLLLDDATFWQQGEYRDKAARALQLHQSRSLDLELHLDEDDTEQQSTTNPFNVDMHQGVFYLDAVFGDNMVLQHGSKSAIYGFLDSDSCLGVEIQLHRYDDDDTSQEPSLVYQTTETLVHNSTKQHPFEEADQQWKALLPPQSPGGNYSIRASCLARPKEATTRELSPLLSLFTITLHNITFGDVWFCSGQSNMGLPLRYTFDRNNTLQDMLMGKYVNIRIMAGYANTPPYDNSNGYGTSNGSNPWRTARQAIRNDKWMDFGATCWHFAQSLVDQGIDLPIGLINTAVGESRISLFMDSTAIHTCQREREDTSRDGQLFRSHILPFVDFAIKGWIWYQGEHNMQDIKGSSRAKIGYGCQLKALIDSWRSLWSETPNTTGPLAPFGIVTLASSANMGRFDWKTNLGMMRHAQTANYGVLPNSDLPNTFLAQAYDLNDEWGAFESPCFQCNLCEGGPKTSRQIDNAICNAPGLQEACRLGVCAVAAGTTPIKSELHPRNKKAIGERLAVAAYNTVYGGTQAYTGPTLQGCSMILDPTTKQKQILEVRFNTTLLRGDSLSMVPYPPLLKPKRRSRKSVGGSQLWIQSKAKAKFCMEQLPVVVDSNDTSKSAGDLRFVCPEWAGGNAKNNNRHVRQGVLDNGWIMVNFTLAPNSQNAIHVDLSSLPERKRSITAIRYAWGFVDCCDHTNPNLYVDHGCIANCPLRSSQGQLPANPFQAKIVQGRCRCVAPQECKG